MAIFMKFRDGFTRLDLSLAGGVLAAARRRRLRQIGTTRNFNAGIQTNCEPSKRLNVLPSTLFLSFNSQSSTRDKKVELADVIQPCQLQSADQLPRCKTQKRVLVSDDELHRLRPSYSRGKNVTTRSN